MLNASKTGRVQVCAAFAAGLMALMTGMPGGAAQGVNSLSANDGLQRRIDENDMLARARAELQAPSETPLGSPREHAQSDDPGDAVREEALDAEIARRLSEAERQAELDELSSRLKQRAAAGPKRPQVPIAEPSAHPTATSPVEEQRAASRQMPPPQVHSAPGTKATVVLVIAPGHTGIRRNNPTADPILCISGTCWISRGPGNDAREVRRDKALGPLNTLGTRAGACNGRTACVFRNVDLVAQSAVLQPVDLRLIRHDRREARSAGMDPSCRVEHGAVACALPQDGADYRMWILPEPVATAAGPSALELLAARTDAAYNHRLTAGRY